MAYLTPDFINRYEGADPGWGFNGLGYIVFKRTYARPIYDEDRTEEWHETVGRVVNGAIDIDAGLSQEEAEALFEDIFYLRALPGGRMLWQLGTDNVKRLGGDSLVNCWYTNLKDVSDFGWMFERLMLGGGVGFSVLDPESLGVVRQGKVTHLPEANDADFIVPDKREGWADLADARPSAPTCRRGRATTATSPTRPSSSDPRAHLSRPSAALRRGLGFSWTASGRFAICSTMR